MKPTPRIIRVKKIHMAFQRPAVFALLFFAPLAAVNWCCAFDLAVAVEVEVEVKVISETSQNWSQFANSFLFLFFPAAIQPIPLASCPIFFQPFMNQQSYNQELHSTLKLSVAHITASKPINCKLNKPQAAHCSVMHTLAVSWLHPVHPSWLPAVSQSAAACIYTLLAHKIMGVSLCKVFNSFELFISILLLLASVNSCWIGLDSQSNRKWLQAAFCTQEPNHNFNRTDWHPQRY